MVASGTATIYFIDQNNEQQSLSDHIDVPRRTMTWVPYVGGATGQPGQGGSPAEIDVCFQLDFDGLTASKECTSPFDAQQFFIPRVAELDTAKGFSAGRITGSGPNGGLWFVNQMTAKMDLRTQIHARWRNPGAPWTLEYAPTSFRNACNASGVYISASVYQANAVCTSNLPNFNSAVSCLWSHESLHMSKGVAEAKSAANDVYALWEPLVRGSLGDLTTAARALYSGAHTQVRDTLIGAHALMTPHYFGGWWADLAAGWRNYSYEIFCP